MGQWSGARRSATIRCSMTPTLYLHGFASSPRAKKAQILGSHFLERGWPFDAPELVTEGFGRLTLTGQLAAIEAAAAGRAVNLIGSSMGGYLAALYAARHAEVKKIVLLAPAFGFARRWAESMGVEAMEAWERTGQTTVMNYSDGGEAEVWWGLMEDARGYEEEPEVRQRCLIYHGVRDTVVSVEASREFARGRAGCELVEVEDGHELIESIDGIWRGVERFFGGQS